MYDYQTQHQCGNYQLVKPSQKRMTHDQIERLKEEQRIKEEQNILRPR